MEVSDFLYGILDCFQVRIKHGCGVNLLFFQKIDFRLHMRYGCYLRKDDQPE